MLFSFRKTIKNKKLSCRPLSGIGLLETAIFIFAVGVILSATLPFANYYNNFKQTTTTRDNLQTVQQALEAFYQKNKYYPCPALMTASVDSQNYGVEDPLNPCTAILPPNNVTTFNVTPPTPLNDGTWRAVGVKSFVLGINEPVRVGTLPLRTLNLPDGAGIDGWGHRLVYAVVERYADHTNHPVTLDVGAITINDSNGNSAIAVPGSGVYVVNAFGSDVRGTYNAQGQLSQPCAVTGPVGSNCSYPLYPVLSTPEPVITFINTVNKNNAATSQLVTNNLIYHVACDNAQNASYFGPTINCNNGAHMYVYNMNPPGDPRAHSIAGFPVPPAGDVSLMATGSRISGLEYYTTQAAVPYQPSANGFPQHPSLQSWFGVCFDGTFIVPPPGGAYTFYGGADDGMVMWIDPDTYKTSNIQSAASYPYDPNTPYTSTNPNIPNYPNGVGPAVSIQDEFGGWFSQVGGEVFQPHPLPPLWNTQTQGFYPFPGYYAVPENGYQFDSNLPLDVTNAAIINNSLGYKFIHNTYNSWAAPPASPAGGFWTAQGKPVYLTPGPHAVMIKYWQGWPMYMGYSIFAFGPSDPLPPNISVLYTLGAPSPAYAKYVMRLYGSIAGPANYPPNDYGCPH